MSTRQYLACAIGLLVVLVALLSPLDREINQLIIFPLALLLLVVSQKEKQVLLSSALILASVFVGISAYANYGTHGRFILAKLSEDPDEVKTARFRELLKTNLYTKNFHIARFYREISKTEEALKLFEANHHLIAALFGNDRKVQIKFAPRQSMPIEFDSLSNKLSKRTSLKPITKVWGTSLSIQAPGTAESTHYITALLKGFNKHEVPSLAERLSLVQLAGSIKGLWPSNAHLAFASWVLGNMYITENIQADDLTLGTLFCAYRQYERALRLMPNYKDNVALAVSVYNNKAFLSSIMNYSSPRKNWQREARRNIKIAQKIIHKYPHSQTITPDILETVKFNTLILYPNKKHKSLMQRPVKLKRLIPAVHKAARKKRL